MTAVEDLCRKIRSELCGLKEGVRFNRDSCDEMKRIDYDVKEITKEAKWLTEKTQKLRSGNRRQMLTLEELKRYQRAP